MLLESRPPIGVAINVSRVASGRQQNLTGANGEVPIPAETCSRMFAPQCDAPLARERSRPQLVTSAPYNGRHSCPPWGVAGQHQLVTIGGEAVQHPRLR